MHDVFVKGEKKIFLSLPKYAGFNRRPGNLASDSKQEVPLVSTDRKLYNLSDFIYCAILSSC